MTERRARAVDRAPDYLQIGPSRLSWRDGALTILFDEIAAPLPSRLRGEVRVTPTTVLGQAYDLDGHGRHLWRPIAPRAEVELALEGPGEGWRGSGYFDSNSGVEPLEDAFSGWTWSRAHLPGESRLFYDVVRREGGAAHLALTMASDGSVATVTPSDFATLPPTFWRLPRAARPLGAAPPRLVRTLEDAPFYARSLLQDCSDGEIADVVHESLDANRLRSPVVRAMLPFRMPRTLW